jgi:DNA-directed RNA polymerase subunit K/omega
MKNHRSVLTTKRIISPSIKYVEHTTMQSSFATRDDVLKNTDVKRISDPYFTKYEYTTLLACRAQQIAEGAIPLVSITEFNTNDPKFIWKVSEREILERKLPYIVKRKLPNGQIEFWPVSELELAW